MIAYASLRNAAFAALSLALSGSAFAAQISVTDLTGRVIKLEKPAAHIVAFPVPMASVVIALDDGIGRLAGLHPEAKLAIEDGILGTFYPSAKTLPSNILAEGAARGRLPNIEELAKIKPDLVVQWSHAGEDAIASLTKAGFTTALLTYGGEKDFRGAVRLIGDAMGKPGKVEMLLKWRDDTTAAIEKGMATVAETDRPKVAYFFYALTDLNTEGAGTYGDWQIRHAGGINAAGKIDNWQKVTPEEVAAWDPDVILVGNFERGLHVDRIYKDPILGKTKAALTKRVYKMPLGGYRWGPASIESPLVWMWLADLLHPGAFHFDVRGAIAEWYPKIYGHAPTAAQIDAILEIPMNGASANYEQFAAK